MPETRFSPAMTTLVFLFQRFQLLLSRIDLLHRPIAVADDVDALGGGGCIDPLA